MSYGTVTYLDDTIQVKLGKIEVSFDSTPIEKYKIEIEEIEDQIEDLKRQTQMLKNYRIVLSHNSLPLDEIAKLYYETNISVKQLADILHLPSYRLLTKFLPPYTVEFTCSNCKRSFHFNKKVTSRQERKDILQGSSLSYRRPLCNECYKLLTKDND